MDTQSASASPLTQSTPTKQTPKQDERKLGINLTELKAKIQADIKKTEQRLRNAR